MFNPAHDRVVQKIAPPAIVDQADNQPRAPSAWSQGQVVAANTVKRRNRRTQPARQRTYIRLCARVDRLEDAISHFYNVINELRRRVSTLGGNADSAEAADLGGLGNASQKVCLGP
jgi:hypothetical protein